MAKAVLKKIVQFSVIVLVLLVAFPVIGSAEKVVVIDPGHGGKHTGTCGVTRESGKDICERDVNLAVSLKIREYLKGSGITVRMTRETDKHFSTYLKLANGDTTGGDFDIRMQVANAFAKGNNDNSIFVSVHHNGHPSRPDVKGVETYYYDGVNHAKSDWPHDPLQPQYMLDNKRLAESIHPNLVRNLGSVDRKIHNDQSFYVIRNAQMPGVLLEIGYMTNRQEETNIKSAAFQAKAAQSIATGIINYFKVFDVYKDNKKLATFKTSQEAINYASKQSGSVRVFDKDKQVDVWNNANFHVFHKTKGLLKSLSTEQEAISFAQANGETRVVSKSTGWTIWSNFITKKYEILDNNNAKLGAYFDSNQAIEVAKKTANRKVVRTGSNEVLWTNISGQAVTRVISNKKVFGLDRYLTAVNVSKELYPNGFAADKPEKTVILATGQNPADSLSAAPLSPVNGNAPLLLTKTNILIPEVKNEISRLGTKKVIIIGGPGAVSVDAENEIKAMGITTERIQGIDRYETNMKILSKLGNVNGVFLASGKSYADALAAAPIAASNGWGIVLTEKNAITNQALAYMKGKQIVILGGTGVIYEKISNTILSQNDKNKVRRLGGATRYETLASMLWYFKDQVKSDTVYITTGQNFPDAMAAAPLSIGNKAPLILVDNRMNINVESFLERYAEENYVSNVKVVGGVVPDAITNIIVNNLK